MARINNNNINDAPPAQEEKHQQDEAGNIDMDGVEDVGRGGDGVLLSPAAVVVRKYWWKGLIHWYNRQDYLAAMECWEEAVMVTMSSSTTEGQDDAAGAEEDQEEQLEKILIKLGNLYIGGEDATSTAAEPEKGEGGASILWLFLAGCQLDARRYDDCRRTLLRCLRDELAQQRHQLQRASRGGGGRLRRCTDRRHLDGVAAAAVAAPASLDEHRCDRVGDDEDRSIVHRALAEWIASYEEQEQEELQLNGGSGNGGGGEIFGRSSSSSDTSVSYRAVEMAIRYRVPGIGWTDPYQRPGFIYSHAQMIENKPVYDSNDFEWCRMLESDQELYNEIREEFMRAYYSNADCVNCFYPVGAGRHRDGAGEHDGNVVVGDGGGRWTECVLFGSGAATAAVVAPKTRRWIRQHVPDAVSLAEAGGGEVIFSVLGPNTKIKSHCGSTNLRLTAHLGLVVPKGDGGTSDSNATTNRCRCRIRVEDQWLTWEEGKVLVFDDSYEHEVENSTDSIRAVLLFRFWHPSLPPRERDKALDQALQAKRKDELRRYNPPPPPPTWQAGAVPADDDVDQETQRSRRQSVERRACEQTSCPGCWCTGYQSIRVAGASDGTNAYNVASSFGSECSKTDGGDDCFFVCSCGQRI